MEKAIEGATLDDIRAKRSQKPEVRAAAREAALRSFLHMLAFAHLSCSLIWIFMMLLALLSLHSLFFYTCGC